MEPAYVESRPIMPKNLSYLLILVLWATWAFMFISKYVFYTKMNIWIIVISGVLFLLMTLLCILAVFTFSIYDDRIEIKHFIRKMTLPMDQVIDTKSGDLTIIKNYAGWNLKGVKYKTFSAVGEESGVGIKLTGKRVVFVSTMNPDKITSLLPKE